VEKEKIVPRSKGDAEFCVFPQVPVHMTVVQQSESICKRGLPELRCLLHQHWCVLAPEPSISQLIDAIGQNQLEVLKESAEECLDLRVHKETPAAVKDEVPVTQWEAERKKEVGLAAETTQGGDLNPGGWEKEGERVVGEGGGLLGRAMVFSYG